MIKFFAIVRQSIATAAAAAAIAAAGGALTSSPAFADSVTTTTSTSVSYADLDLSTPAGQAKMNVRVRAAARHVCGYYAGERDLAEVAHQNACVAQAMNGAQTELAALSTQSNSGQRIAVRDAADRNVPRTAR